MLSGFAAKAALPVPATDSLDFDVIRKSHKIGEHFVTFQREGDRVTVAVAADIVVGIGPIALFRYRHRSAEVWEGGRIVSVASTTNDDGTPKRMTARRDDAGLWVEGSDAPLYLAPHASIPGTHWNRAMLDAPFVNTQDGRLMRPSIANMGIRTVDVGARTVEATEYRLRGDADLETYYDAAPAWVGLRFHAKDGSDVIYRRR
jgi:hypothetical protein